MGAARPEVRLPTRPASRHARTPRWPGPASPSGDGAHALRGRQAERSAVTDWPTGALSRSMTTPSQRRPLPSPHRLLNPVVAILPCLGQELGAAAEEILDALSGPPRTLRGVGTRSRANQNEIAWARRRTGPSTSARWSTPDSVRSTRWSCSIPSRGRRNQSTSSSRWGPLLRTLFTAVETGRALSRPPAGCVSRARRSSVFWWCGSSQVS